MSELGSYRLLLDEMEKWFRSICVRYPDQMQCARGCTLCCYGLFDVSLPDAVLVLEGMGKLPETTQNEIIERATGLQRSIQEAAPNLKTPFFLDTLSEEQIDQIVDLTNEQRCPFLSGRNQCLIYECRPLACRLEGIPMIDVEDGLFDDWCELNFINGVPSHAVKELKRDYARIQEIEAGSTVLLSKKLLGHPSGRVTLFIPSLVVEFKGWWWKALGSREL